MKGIPITPEETELILRLRDAESRRFMDIAKLLGRSRYSVIHHYNSAKTMDRFKPGCAPDEREPLPPTRKCNLCYGTFQPANRYIRFCPNCRPRAGGLDHPLHPAISYHGH